MDHNKFLFIPLGGVGNIGMNVSLYHFRGKWLIVDLGIGFADSSYMPGIDIVVPDISFIRDRRDDLLGIVLTHGHEDHFGAIQYLWDELMCPIYTTKFTSSLLKTKLNRYTLKDKIVIREINISDRLILGPFTLDFVNMTHSIPEMNAIAIHTELGSVLHTGDWKLDDFPVIGDKSDTEKLSEIGEKGVLALVCDSTNILVPGRSGSESSIYGVMFDIIKDCKHSVAIAMFSSNLARIITITKVAQSLGRKVVILGRSLWRVIHAAKESGYVGDDIEFLDAEQCHVFPRNKLIFICTGCQGEELAAASRLSINGHPLVKLLAEDTIIFSSKIIPGNERKIYDMFNNFVVMGVRVITESTHDVHVSGHPARDEIREIYKMVKPRFSIPVHGEYIHTYEHINLAKELGVEKAIKVSPGDVIDLKTGENIESVPHGYFGVDGLFLRDPESNVMKMRRRLRDSGIIFITLILDRNGDFLKPLTILAPGVLDPLKDKVIIKKISRKIVQSIRNVSENSLNKAIYGVVSSFLRNKVKGKPLIEIQIERL